MVQILVFFVAIQVGKGVSRAECDRKGFLFVLDGLQVLPAVYEDFYCHFVGGSVG